MSEPVRPLYVGKANAEIVIGRSWRAVRDMARERGVRPRRVGRITLYLATELVEAIERHAAAESAPEEVDDGTELDRLRAQLGKKRRRA